MTTTQLTTADVARELYQAFLAGDVEGILARLAEDVVFHVPGTGVNAGDHVGHAGVLGFIGQAAAETAGTLDLVIHDITSSDRHAVVLATYTATRPGRDLSLENNIAHVLRVEDGRVTESWYHSRNQYEVDEFWAAEA